MIRTKAKSLLLVIMLVFASMCLFACKEKPTVGVESIVFEEQSISLLVGDEYSPEVKVLPSYATNKSYTLISNDITALKVDGGTITAVKSALGVKLKVVSNDNQNLNDVISINIYDESVDLQTPTALSFDGNKLTFAGKDNVNGYMLSINDNEINIGNNTEYSFDSIISKLGDLHNQVVECKVKSVGDGKVFNDSAYSEPISFVKLSHVKNSRIENNTLLFDGIENVATYTIEVFNQGVLDSSKTRVINGTSLNLDYLVDNINGSECTIKITPNTNDYVLENVVVFSGESVDVEFAVVGQVKNVSINNRVLSWDFVKNAETYSVDLFKGNDLLQSYNDIQVNNLTLDFAGAGEYRCEILANSTKANTTTGSEISQISFKILATPTFVIENNRVAWSKVQDAEGYLVTITNSQNQVLINKGFVFATDQSLVTYDVSAFGADVYAIKVIACGNEQTILSSTETEAAEFIKLGDVRNLRVIENTLVWQNNGVNPVCKYKVSIADGTGNYVVDLAKDDGKVQYDTARALFMYSLEDYSFIAKNDDTTYYDISVQAMGGGNAFDAGVSETKVAKLADASIKELKSGWFTINKSADAVKHDIKISKVGDSGFTPIVLNSTSSGDRFQLIETELTETGEYVAQVFAYGNNGNILDAENNDEGIKLIKLTAPTLTVDSGKKIQVEEQIENAQEYKVYVTRPNGSTTNFDLLAGYDLVQNATMVGNYVFTAKSIGGGAYVKIDDTTGEMAYVLDSVVGIQELKVKKLASPTITFDKGSVTATINCDDSNNNGVNYVDNYTFTITKKVGTSASISELVVATDSNVVDCSNYIDEAATYILEAKANPKSSIGEYALVLESSTSVAQSVTKLSGVCDFTVSNGNLNIKQNSLSLSSGEQYKLKLTIDKGTASEIVIDNISNQGSQFIVYAYNANNYSIVNNSLIDLFASGGTHTLHTEISCINKANVIASKIEECGTLNVLGKVTTIAKNGETIEFNAVQNATNYYAIIKLNNNEKVINLNGNYIALEDGKISLGIDKLKTLMQSAGVVYLEQTEYSIKFVATSEDVKTFANRGDAEYKFKFLTTPNLSVVREENGFDKNLVVLGDDVTTNYNVVIKQGDTLVSEYNNTTTTTFNLDDIELIAGNVTAEVTAIVTSGDYFNSKTQTLNAIKLASPELVVNNGLVQWNAVANAEQYNLTYSNSQTTETIILKRGVENFAMDFSTCTYNFDILSAGINNLSLQVDAVVGNYLNSDSGTAKEVYKSNTPIIEVVSGKICIKLQKLDIPHTARVEVKVDDSLVNAGLYIENGELKTNNSDIVINSTETLYVVTINPETLLKYGTTELDDENITVKLYATSDGKSLNSSTISKTVYGLLSPVGLDIVTSYTKPEGSTYITEVLEKIQWQNPVANDEYVAEYEVIINYNNVKYTFIVNQPIFMMPTYYMEDANNNGKLDCSEDINGNEQLDEGEDINGNGILDSVEVVFGAGTYSISVRSLTDNNDNIVNSKYCEQINVIVLETPDGLKTEEGNIVWSANTNVEYYLVRIYLLKDAEGNVGKTLIMQTQTADTNNKYDLSDIALDAGVYGISVQAMHNHPRTLSSNESEILQVIRLPQVNSYQVKNGELYISMHPFYTKAQITLTNKITKEIETFLIENSLTVYDEFIGTVTDWASSNVLQTYPLAVPVKYVSAGDTTLRTLNAMDEYDVKVKLYGNSTDRCAIISGAESNNPLNSNLTNENKIKKLITPTLSVSEDERGIILLGLTENIVVPVEYFKHIIDGQTASLKGVHLYQVNLSINSETKVMYVADVVDEGLFASSGCAITQDDDDNKLKHFVYDGKMFNVLDKTLNKEIKFNFNTNKYYYYAINDLVNYQYSEIDLSKGGSFVVSARFLGDDTMYTNSNVSAQIKIDRYKSISAGITKGEVYWENQAGELDHPVYIMEISKGSDNDKEEYKLVLYHEGIASHNIDKLKEQFGDKYFFDVIKYDVDNSYVGENITYTNLSNKLHEMRKQKGISDSLNKGGAFTISIRAHYTSSSPNNTILSQQASSLSAEILPQTNIKLVNGVLTWELASIKTTSGTGIEYIYDYQLQIDDGNSTHKVILSYDTSKETGDYALNGTTATYELTEPTMLTGFTFNAGGTYSFNLTAVSLQAVNSTQVNSIATDIKNIKILENVDIYIDNGLVKWGSGQSVELGIGYMYNDAYVSFTKILSGQQYSLPTYETIGGTDVTLASGVQYKIKARLKGNSVNNINGFYSGVQTMQRLTTVRAESIKTVDGIMVWEDSSYRVFDQAGNFVENTSDGISYTIVYSYVEDGVIQTKTVSNIMNKSFDFTGVPAGEIKVKIYANHNFNFTSFASDEITLYKLSTPLEKYSVDTQNNTISWNMIVDNVGNPITTYQVVVKEGDITSNPMDSDNVWEVEGVSSSEFKIIIRAVVKGEGNLINSDYTEGFDVGIPNSVNIETFTFDEQLQQFKWMAIEGEQEGDTYYIGYQITSSGSVNVYEDKVELLKDGDGYYYFKPYIIGTYDNIYIKVVRAESLPSQLTYYKGDSASILEFKLFESGDGKTKDSAYVIINETQLRNIKYFPGAVYQIPQEGSDPRKIDLTSSDPILDKNIVFTGQIYGNGATIKGLTIDRSGDTDTYIGLFHKMQNAIIDNIKLEQFDIIVNNPNTNAYEMYIGILTAQASSTTFTNIVVVDSAISITKNTEDDAETLKSIYFGAIAGYAVDGCVFDSCEIKLRTNDKNISNVTIDATGSVNSTIAVGGIAGYAKDCRFVENVQKEGDNTFISYIAPSTQSKPSIYYGALVGQGQGLTIDNVNYSYGTKKIVSGESMIESHAVNIGNVVR